MTTGSVDAPEVTAPPAAPVTAPKKNVFQRIAGVLFAPAETFQDIARRPDIVAPLLVIVLLSYVSTVLVMPKLDFESMIAQQAEQLRKQNPNMGDEDLERMARITRASAKVMGYIGPLLMLIWYVIVAAVLFGGVRMMGGEGTFAQAFSATLYAWMPLVLFGILSTIIILARGSFDPSTMATVVKSNPAFLVDMKEHPVLFSLLSSFDLFTIWTIILLVFGFAALSRLSRAKAAGVVLTSWIVLLVVKLGFAALGASRMKG